MKTILANALRRRTGWLTLSVTLKAYRWRNAASLPMKTSSLQDIVIPKLRPDGTQPPKGVVVIAHGLGGGGQNTYMDLADYFTSNGYLVFAYDVTGMIRARAVLSKDCRRV